MNGLMKSAMVVTARSMILTLATTGMVVSAASAASMDAMHWYGGLGLGLGKSRNDFTSINQVSDDKDFAWKLFGGYQFHPNAAVELGYVDLGEFKGKGTYSGSPFTDSFKAKGFNLGIVGKFPVTDEFSVLGRVGAMRWDVDDKATALGSSFSESKTGVDATLGIGGQYDIDRNMGVRVEWERFNNVGDKNVTGETKIDLLSASFVYTIR